MPTEYIPCGNGYIKANLPEHTRIIRANKPLPPIPNIPQRIKQALNNPIGIDPLHKLVNNKSKIVIAFDDASGNYFQTQRTDFRQTAIEIIVEQLRKIGVPLNNITLLLAQGLHRKLSRTEMETFLGRKLILQFGYNNLYCHDAEDPKQLTHLGYTHRGFDVEINNAILNADQFIYLNTMWAPFNGGWKSTAVGLGTFRSIRHHHRPWPISTGQSVDDPKNSSFKKLVWEQGALIENALAQKGKQILTIESIYDNSDPKKDIIAINAGNPTQVHPHTLNAIQQQQIVPVKGQTDILIAGIANWNECYSKFSTVNPILAANQAMANTIMQFQNMPLIRKGGIAIIAHPLTPDFDQQKFAPYTEFYQKLLPQNTDPYWLWENHVDDFAHRPQYIHAYRHAHAYHGAHPFFMWNSTAIPKQYLSKIIFAGVQNPQIAHHLGFQAHTTIENAIAAAQAELGTSATITLMQRPPHFIPKVSPA